MSESAKDRVIKEHAELKEKYIKLVDFMYSENYVKIPSNQRYLLRDQKGYMEDYLSVLTKRIITWDMTKEEIDNME